MLLEELEPKIPKLPDYNDIGPFMRDYTEEHDNMSAPRRMLVGSYRGDKILLSTPLL